jgi:hypothetical protein
MDFSDCRHSIIDAKQLHSFQIFPEKTHLLSPSE